MTTNNVETRIITFTKEYGKKWVTEFMGRITRREINHIRRLLPIEFAREARRKSFKRIQADRERRLIESMRTEKVKDLPIVESVQPSKPVETQKETKNVAI